MGYCCKETERRKHVRLAFKRKELLYDAENYAFVEGDMMSDEAGHARHQVMDIGQKGNVDRATRVMNLTHAECVEMMYPYTKEEISEGTEALDDVMAAPEEYAIELWLPEGFSQTTVNLLREMIHEYMVCRVLADWMSITNPRSQANWESKAVTARRRIETALMGRRGRMRRKLKPF